MSINSEKNMSFSKICENIEYFPQFVDFNTCSIYEGLNSHFRVENTEI